MKIIREEYLVFYDELVNRFSTSQELHGKIRTKNGTRDIWLISKSKEEIIHGATTQEKSGSMSIASDLFDLGKQNLYFYRAHIAAKTKHINIRPSSLIKALLYLGVGIPEEHQANWDFLSDEEKAKCLFSEFTNSHNKKIRHISSKTRDTQNNISYEATENDQIKELVRGFYEDITKRKFESAWEKLSDNFKMRDGWDGEFEKFRIGYTSTVSIRDIDVFNIKKANRDIYDCKVFYEDQIDVYPFKHLSNLDEFTLSDIDEFTQKISIIRNVIHELDGKNAGQIPIARLFSPSAIEYIRYICQIDSKKLHQFGIPTKKILYRLCNCTCILIKNSWQIDNIVSQPVMFPIR